MSSTLNASPNSTAANPVTSHVSPITDIDTTQTSQLHFDEVPKPPKDDLLGLADIRQQRNITLDAAASALRLSQAQITALENQHWSALPAAAYVKGFLRNYARLLTVPAEPYIAQFDRSLGIHAPGPTANTNSPSTAAPLVNQATKNNAAKLSVQAPLQLHIEPTALAHSETGHQSKTHQSLFGLVGLLIAATLVFLLVWERSLWLPAATRWAEPITQWVSAQWAGISAPPVSPSASPAPIAAAPAPEISTAAPVTPIPLESSAANAGTQAASGPTRMVQFDMSKAVWLEVRDSGNNVIYSGTKPPGTKDSIQGAAPLSVVIGAADALKMTVDGAAFDVQAQANANVARFNIP